MTKFEKSNLKAFADDSSCRLVLQIWVLWEKEKILVTSTFPTMFSKKSFFSRDSKSHDCVVKS